MLHGGYGRFGYLLLLPRVQSLLETRERVFNGVFALVSCTGCRRTDDPRPSRKHGSRRSGRIISKNMIKAVLTKSACIGRIGRAGPLQSLTLLMTRHGVIGLNGRRSSAPVAVAGVAPNAYSRGSHP